MHILGINSLFLYSKADQTSDRESMYQHSMLTLFMCYWWSGYTSYAFAWRPSMWETVIITHSHRLKVGLVISQTNVHSQWNLVYKAFHPICCCGNEIFVNSTANVILRAKHFFVAKSPLRCGRNTAFLQVAIACTDLDLSLIYILI